MWRLAAIPVVLAGGVVPAVAGPASGPAGPALPEERLVMGLHPPERIAALDVATGEIEQRRLPGGTLCHGPLMVADERSLAVVPGKPGVQYLPSARPGAFWALRVRFDRVRATASGVREVTAAGRTLFRARRRPPPGYPEGAVRDGIVFEHHGKRRVWYPRTGAVRPTGGDWLVAASEHGSAWCDGRCRRLRLEMTTGRATALAPRKRSFLAGGGRLSPDGSVLAVALYPARRHGETAVALVATADGSLDRVRVPAADGGALAWSPSGEWLYIAAAGRRVVAYRPRERSAVTLPVRLGGEVLDMFVSRSTSRRSAGS